MSILNILAVFCICLSANIAFADEKVLCYYNSGSFYKAGQGKFDRVEFLEPAIQLCTHLIYGYAGINEQNHNIRPLNEHFDVTQNNYRHVTDLKKRYPGLKVLLSVGGGEDVSGEGADKNMKYRTILETVDSRLAFVNSLPTFLKNFGFDGLDLGWEFPETKPKKIHSKFKSFFINIKHKIVGESIIDEKAAEHKEEFTAFVREIKNNFKHEGLLLTLSVLPNVNSSVYYDVRALTPNLDFVILKAFDFYNPKRNPWEADYPAPLYELLDRKPDENADYQVRYWLEHGAPNNKIILGIPTFARTWKMNEDSGISGVPPLLIDGPAPEGNYSKEPGLLSYPEVCTKLANPQRLSQSAGTHLRKIGDPSKRYGVYAFRLADAQTPDGIWVGYEDPDTAGNKASYAKAKGLGGIAIDDLTQDDFRGLCTGDKFPILRAAKFRL